MRPIIKFLQEARTELAKVSWPTRSTVINLTLAVLLVAIVLTAYVAGVDYSLTQGVKWLTIKSQEMKKPAPKETPKIDLGKIQADLNNQLQTENQ